MLADDELRATVRAGQRWAKERDIPDPVGWADLAHAVDATVEVIRGRTGGALAPTRAHTLPLPKGVGAGLRQLTVPDPFDDIVFRALVGRAATVIDDALGPEVASYRLAEAGPGWKLRDYRYAQGLRNDELQERIGASSFRGLGTLDIRSYYPSINIDRLEGVLFEVGCDPTVAVAVTGYLRDWQLWGVQGVPIGPEASGLLGNVFLISADRALRDVGIEFGRYTDDYRLWLNGPASWPVARDAVAAAVADLGLQLNPSKTRHLRTPHGVLHQLINIDLDELRALLAIDPAAGLTAAANLFDAEVAQPAPDPKRLKFLLGVLKHRSDPHAVGAAQDRPQLLQADPRTWAAYLKVMHGKNRLDRDWLLEQATAPPTAETAAVAFHLMSVIAARPVGREHGRALGAFATDNNKAWAPVRCAAAQAWMTSEDWNAGKATEAALADGDPQQRRALALTLRRTEPGKKVERALTKLQKAVPECRPAVAWMRNGAHLAAA